MSSALRRKQQLAGDGVKIEEIWKLLLFHFLRPKMSLSLLRPVSDASAHRETPGCSANVSAVIMHLYVDSKHKGRANDVISGGL